MVLTHDLDEVDGMLVVGLLCAGLYDVGADEEARPTYISQTRVTFCRIDEGVFEQKAVSRAFCWICSPSSLRAARQI